MKKLIIISIILIGFLFNPCFAEEKIGRYQLIIFNTQKLFMLDSETGKVWLYKTPEEAQAMYEKIKDSVNKEESASLLMDLLNGYFIAIKRAD